MKISANVLQALNLDAADTVWFARELEKIDETAYMDLLPGNLARQFIPDVLDVAAWQESYTYRMFSGKGRAEIASTGGNGDGSPRVTLTGREYTRTIKQLDESYGWTVREIQKAAATRTPLDQMTVSMARAAMDAKIDTLLARGNSDHGIEGLLSLSAVDPADCTPTAKTSGTKWATAANTADQILADINKVTTQLFQGLKQTNAPQFNKFVLLVPTDAYARIATTPRSSTSDTTILKFAMENNPWLESIEPWYHCDDAGAGDVGRLMAYARNPLCLGGLVPEEFRSLNPQERNTEIVVPVMGSCGGVVCRYPVAVRYMDDV